MHDRRAPDTQTRPVNGGPRARLSNKATLLSANCAKQTCTHSIETCERKRSVKNLNGNKGKRETETERDGVGKRKREGQTKTKKGRNSLDKICHEPVAGQIVCASEHL
ncbi:hypothetical protein M514_07575 [Trichuris suis]|uniref:Uncharacterized protein n=1 Tax=Trichuris suis TaxID=68888 RepID=A0A085M2S9_9BILA|nr:hypothetical protein M513_07575 [Trichuris suis]KFD67208.1 hypothetical protein M514_07575 [Trichuris suis]